jgi:hypothetical protein
LEAGEVRVIYTRLMEVAMGVRWRHLRFEEQTFGDKRHVRCLCLLRGNLTAWLVDQIIPNKMVNDFLV